MPQTIAEYPYWEFSFDERGQLTNAAEVEEFFQDVPGRPLTDLFIFSHGWNNDPLTARALYRRFFEQLRAVEVELGTPGKPRQRDASIGVVGLIWPSMRWIDEPEPLPPGQEGAAGLAVPAVAPSDGELVLALKNVFHDKTQRDALDQLADLLTKRPRNAAELARFQSLMAQLTTGKDAAGAQEDNGERALLTEAPQDLFLRFAAIVPRAPAEGGEAGLFDPFSAIWEGAKQALRQATYWEMKKRAGVVGQIGLGPVVGRIQTAKPSLRTHLVGHSFGSRLVSFTLSGLPHNAAGGVSPVKTLFLLQGAFSHFAFAASLPHDPDRGGALAGMEARVDGPLCVTYSLKDSAVGTFYPLASMAAGQDAAAFDDLLYQWGAMGHDGAQAVHAETSVLGPVGQAYPFHFAGRFVNLDGNEVIVSGGFPSGAHSDIVHDRIAWVLLCAAGIAGTSEPAVTAPPEENSGVASLADAARPGEGEMSSTDESATPTESLPEEQSLLRAGPISEAFAMKNPQGAGGWD